mmetsp:Transcript_19967/g.76502  ORF Transcript_19967/g.76502 Transcript_19967/m.76502 type:complete len:279 (+) Transcript_19967:654-1490(+)
MGVPTPRVIVLSETRERPKSATLATHWSVTSTLPHLRSRWMTPSVCRYFMPRAAPSARCTASGTGRATAASSTTAASEPRGNSSDTMNSAPGCMQEPMQCATFSCRSTLISATSDWNSSLLNARLSSSNFLTATGPPRHVAAHTTPLTPRPMTRPSSTSCGAMSVCTCTAPLRTSSISERRKAAPPSRTILVVSLPAMEASRIAVSFCRPLLSACLSSAISLRMPASPMMFTSTPLTSSGICASAATMCATAPALHVFSAAHSASSPPTAASCLRHSS